MEPQTSPSHIRSFVQLTAMWCPSLCPASWNMTLCVPGLVFAKVKGNHMQISISLSASFFTSCVLPCTLQPAQPLLNLRDLSLQLSDTLHLSWAPRPYVVARRCLHPERWPPAALFPYLFPFSQWSGACSAHCLMCENCCFIVWFSCLIPSLESITTWRFRNEVCSCLILIPPYCLYLGC